MKEELFKTELGDKVLRYSDAIVVEFTGKRTVSSTCPLNGGTRTDLKHVFNKSCGKELHGKTCPGMKGKTHVEHFSAIAKEIDLDPATCTGMGTAALVENMAVASESYKSVTVTAMVTAGVDINGGRAGDLARYDEFSKELINLNPSSGTINIMLHINANLPEGALNRAIVTATEAKSVALQELMANSMYSTGLATGSGTDSVIVVANPESETYLENAGKHCMLGQLIGQTVIKATKEALDKQTGMNTHRQSSFLWQNKRYGITEDKIWSYYSHINGDKAIDKDAFDKKLKELDNNKKIVAFIASSVHLIDQYSWGLLDKEAVHDAFSIQIKAFRDYFGLSPILKHTSETHKNMPERSFEEMMISPLILTIAHLI